VSAHARRTSGIRTLLTLGAAVLASLAAAPFAAQAAFAIAPVALTDRLIDEAGVLSSAEEQRLEGRLEQLAQEQDLPELYVIFVDEFTDPSDGPGWVDRVADDSFLGQNQYLLAIATEQRGMAMSYGDDGPLSASRVDEIQDTIASEHLVNDEWAAAVDLAIDEFEHRPTPWWVWLLGIAGLGAVIALIVFATKAIGAARQRRQELADLDGQKRRAGRELLRADSAVRASAQELDFVVAEFGDDATAEFRTVLDDSRAKLTTAFEKQRLLEDSIEDTPAQTRAWTDEILKTCTAIDRALRERATALAKLRDLAGNGRASLERLTAARAGADATLAEAERRIADLRAGYTAADVVLVADVPEQIRASLADADAGLADLSRALETNRSGEITAAIRRVEQELSEVAELREDVEQRARELDARGPRSEGSPAAPASPFASVALERDERGGSDAAMQWAEDRLKRARYLATTLSADLAGTGNEGDKRRLQQVNDAIAAAETARPRGAAEVRRHADNAIGRAEFARRLLSGRSDSYVRRESHSIISGSGDDDGVGLKALGGGVLGAVLGAIVGATQLGGGGLVIGLILGAVFGALSGAFGKGGGSSSSSSGWSSSSHRSSSGSRSSGSSSRSSSSGGGRSSSGRRF